MNGGSLQNSNSIMPIKKRGTLPHVGFAVDLRDMRSKNCLVVKLPDGEERCVSTNMYNFGVRLAEKVKEERR